MDLASNFTSQRRRSELDDCRISISSRASTTPSILASEKVEARLARSPGIKILEMMASKPPPCQTKFSIEDFRLKNLTVMEDISDEYDTDLESDEVCLHSYYIPYEICRKHERNIPVSKVELVLEYFICIFTVFRILSM